MLAPSAWAQGAAAWQIEIESPALAEFLQKYLPAEEVLSEDPIERLGLTRRLRRQLSELLSTQGYFAPEIEIQGERWPVIAHIEPGLQSHIVALDLRFTGALASDARFTPRLSKLRSDWTLVEGDGFLQNSWNDAKTRLLLAVQADDFPAAQLVESLADVDPKTGEARLRVLIDSGLPYTFGVLEIEGLDQYSPQLVGRFNAIRPGEPYSLEKLLSLQSSLQNTPYFSAVDVSIDSAAAQTERVPIKVRVAEGKPKRFSLGTGFSSNTGARAEMAYTHANWLGRAWQLNTGLRLEQRAQAASADVFLPPADAGHIDSFGGIVESSDIKGLKLSRQSIGVARRKPRGNIETRVGVSLQREVTDIDGSERDVTLALALNWSWTQRKVDDLLSPRQGYVWNVQFGGASRYVLSETDFLRSYSRLSTYWPMGKSDVLLVRGELGYTATRDAAGVPQDFLFRTGGSQTIRGYSYLGIGLEEGEAVVGAPVLAVVSAEYVHWMGQWGVAGFVDSGNAVAQVADFKAKWGVGLGVRWKSPAGPLAFDLAYGLADKRVRPHVSIAIAF